MITRWSAIVLALLCAHCGNHSNLSPDRDRDGVEDAADCAPDDDARWRHVYGLYLDADGDGYRASDRWVSACTGFEDVPAGHTRASSPLDCDDQDRAAWWLATLYPDQDRDGHGDGGAAEQCIGAGVPDGMAETDGDCAPGDPGAWQVVAYESFDGDGDGHGAHAPGQVCAGYSLPDGYTDAVLEPDCDDADIGHWVGILGFLDEDRDGVGAGELVELCTNGWYEPGQADTDSDCAPADPTAWEVLTYSHRDADGDGVTVPSYGSVCAAGSLPLGYRYAPTGLDCDDGDGSRWREVTGHADEDGDRVGAGAAQTFCTSGALPVGFVSASGDCAPVDPARWQVLAYTSRDADGDGHTTPESGALCTGAALPPGFAGQSAGNDCNDGDPAVFIGLIVFADTDGDGVGAGAATQACTDGSVPAGFRVTGSDCAPGDAAAWQTLAYTHADADGDGATVALAGQVCAGQSLPEPFRTAASGNDCDDDDPALTRFVLLYPDQDGDGVGAPPRAILCLGASIPPGLSIHGYDRDDTDPGVTEDPEEDALVLQILD
ncbi:MAG TPA: hypothetical protein VNM90_26635 [Haliangium sp.]|nr:hypothetical protein [Haliangium sp.]